MASQNTTNGTSIHISNRNERSFFMTLIFLLLRVLLRFISVDTTPTQEDGSQKLDPTEAQLKKCTIHERTVCGFYIYDYIPPNRTAKNVKKHVYYVAGGSWKLPASGIAFKIMADLAKAMPDTTISLVSVPLAPRNPAPKTFPALMKLYRTLMADADTTGERVILGGDSSGGNIVLCVALEALREDAEQSQADAKKIPHPVAVLAICPSIDLTRKNPDIKRIASRDPLLTYQKIVDSANGWRGEWDPTDRRVSPINNDISLLKRYGVKVHGVTAGCDVLGPDGILFRNACAKEGVQGEWVHWDKQMHCFQFTQPFGIWEGKEVVQWMVDVLKKE